MIRQSVFTFVFSCLALGLFAQQLTLEGYVFEEGNRGYLNEVNIKVLDASTKAIQCETVTNLEGFFSCTVPSGKNYILYADKDIFFPKEQPLNYANETAGSKVFAKVSMKRKPGYLFELTLSDERPEPGAAAPALRNTHIEVYNNTTEKQEVDLPSHPSPTFAHTLKQGNHYTIMIRKDGYFNKRIEAYVNVEGCIVCIDGVDQLTPQAPGVSDVLTEGLSMGTLLANLEVEKASLDKIIEIENIYYDLDKSYIRSDAAVELNKVAAFLKENPALLVELGSHTDSRGKDGYNMKLSERRAKEAVEYLIEKGQLSPVQISARGYGETRLVNKCGNGVPCSEEEHQENRRTELRIVGFSDIDPYENRTLEEIIKEEKYLSEVMNSGTQRFEDLPPEVQKQILEQQKKKN